MDRRTYNWRTLTAWLCKQHQRRRRAAGALAAPEITGISLVWGATLPGWADVTLGLSFAHNGWPVATLEVWRTINGGAEALAGTVASSASSFVDGSLANGEVTVAYRARYRNGAVLGPWSSVLQWDVSPP